MRSMVQNLKEGGGGAKNRILENYQIAYLTVQWLSNVLFELFELHEMTLLSVVRMHNSSNDQ